MEIIVEEIFTILIYLWKTILLDASTFSWKIIKLKYYFLTMYSDLLSKVHHQSNLYLQENR